MFVGRAVEYEISDVPALMEVCKHDPSYPVRCACAAALGAIGDRSALEELYARFPRLAVAAETERVAMRQINGIKHLKVVTDAH